MFNFFKKKKSPTKDVPSFFTKSDEIIADYDMSMFAMQKGYNLPSKYYYNEHKDLHISEHNVINSDTVVVAPTHSQIRDFGQVKTDSIFLITSDNPLPVISLTYLSQLPDCPTYKENCFHLNKNILEKFSFNINTPIDEVLTKFKTHYSLDYDIFTYNSIFDTKEYFFTINNGDKTILDTRQLYVSRQVVKLEIAKQMYSIIKSF